MSVSKFLPFVSLGKILMLLLFILFKAILAESKTESPIFLNSPEKGANSPILISLFALAILVEIIKMIITKKT